MSKLLQTLLVLLLLSPGLVACRGELAGDSQSVSAKPEDMAEKLTGGAGLFAESGCIACHMLEPGPEPAIGPAMTGLAARADRLLQDPDYSGKAKTVSEYIRESITHPDIYLVRGYAPIMPKTYQASLTEQELAELVAYLLSLE